MVYAFGPADEKLGYHYGHDILDTDLEMTVTKSLQVTVIDQTRDGGTGFIISQGKGRAVTIEYLPKMVRKRGPRRRVPDMDQVWGFMVVSQKFKDIVESFEPHVHQFAAVDVYWDAGEPPVGTCYFFIPCNRLDTTHRQLTTWRWSQGEIAASWRSGSRDPGGLVFRKGAHGKASIWCDKYLPDANLCSDAFHDAVQAAGCDGVSFMHFDEA